MSILWRRFAANSYYAMLSSGNALFLPHSAKLLEGLATRQEDQRSNKQAEVYNDGHAEQRPSNEPSGVQNITNVEDGRQGKGEIVKSERQERRPQPPIEQERRLLALVAHENPPRVKVSHHDGTTSATPIR